MPGWLHRCNGHELGQTSGDGEGQGGLACCSPRARQESDRLGKDSNGVADSPCCAVETSTALQSNHVPITILEREKKIGRKCSFASRDKLV